MSSSATKSTHNKRACGKTCLRCWHNKLKHTNKEAKKFLQKQKEANAIESMQAIGNFDIVGERKQSLSRWEKYQARVASKEEEEEKDQLTNSCLVRSAVQNRVKGIEKSNEDERDMRDDLQMTFTDILLDCRQRAASSTFSFSAASLASASHSACAAIENKFFCEIKEKTSKLNARVDL